MHLKNIEKFTVFFAMAESALKSDCFKIMATTELIVIDEKNPTGA